MEIEKSNQYRELISGIKLQIKTSKQQALLAVNKELLILYWNIGNVILKYQDEEVRGAKIIDNIEKEIKDEFPDQKGFSARNLKYMKKFAVEYNDIQFVQQVVAQIPWSHNVVLMDRLKDIIKKIMVY